MGRGAIGTQAMVRYQGGSIVPIPEIQTCSRSRKPTWDRE